MRHRISWTGVLLLILLLLATPASAKAPADRVTITGPGIDQPVEVGGSDMLFNPWAGEFLGDHLERPPASADLSGEPYEAVFWLDASGYDARMIYAFEFYLAGDAEAYIRLPENGEVHHELNASTIIRTTGWYRASEAWAEAVAAVIEPGGEPTTAGSARLDVSGWVTLAVVAVGGTVFAVLASRSRHRSHVRPQLRGA